MQKHILVFTVLCAALLSACEKTIDFKGEDIDPKIVVNGLVTPGKPIEVRITRSENLLSESYASTILKDAVADLYVDDVLTEKLSINAQSDASETYSIPVFSSQTVAESGKTYRLEVSHEGLKPVTCETTVPTPVAIEVDTLSTLLSGSWGTGLYIMVSLKFSDNAETKDYYRAQMDVMRGVNKAYYDSYNEPEDLSDTVLIRFYASGVDISDPIFKGNDQADDIVTGTPENRFALFDDSDINGKEYILKLGFMANPNYSAEIEEGSGNFFEQQIILKTLTPEYYEYLNSVNSHFWYGDDYFSEPVPVYSNVKGGLGIFASEAPAVYTIIFGNYPLDDKVYIENYNYGGYGYDYGY